MLTDLIPVFWLVSSRVSWFVLAVYATVGQVGLLVWTRPSQEGRGMCGWRTAVCIAFPTENGKSLQA